MIDLAPFCATPLSLRFGIQEPWSSGEYTYATNGHIIVRVARRLEIPANRHSTNAEKLFDGMKNTGNWLRVPECAKPDDVECKWCDGTGVDEEEEYCTACDGTGKTESLEGLVVGNANFQKKYLALIQGWEIVPIGANDPAWIRTDGADGILMPRRME
ncbi:hypothetical protein UFOVP891_9 [uncultured Caudovirales phage]|uniref:Uncharacterized protein n=1 Tax=uncultured Caudovirales phage TaxID=2100421 RepID=A0A6J5REJ8_9CAUD|nr:hypothetical protein UFOVP472_59 [uncultured Caudovirales phage]CAB4168940.1 hypothetical protein UFOVP891_9 [uncultured Caudovirales phage]CAB4180799.1 hypothetical protein UFOVP1053_59 [uncultured Caudovirales phage]CAB4195469.1 hypothetical protein UFOVP1297_15 [uncultured Caudovirales phage]CAB4221919.1 hypothetical protein UFOVP1647_55 [uncultured Caudovirales phage]